MRGDAGADILSLSLPPSGGGRIVDLRLDAATISELVNDCPSRFS